MEREINTFDGDYYKRYPKRNMLKTQSILKNVGHVESILDIGCNYGYILRAFLEKAMVDVAHGVELHGDVIDPWLINNKKFRLFQTDITKLNFDRAYDLIIYNAVHHHVIGKYGKRVATETWHNIIDHCNKYLIFETGLISETGEYYWKDELIRLFGTDEFYLTSLFHSIGPRLDKVKKIKKLKIHGTKRSLYKFALHPTGSDYDLKRYPKEFFGHMYSTDPNYHVVMKLQRTVGSHNQELVNISDHEVHREDLWDETDFYLIQKNNSQERFFCKKIHDPYKQMREFAIHMNIDYPKVLSPIEVSNKFGLVFPYLSWAPLTKIDFSNIENKEQLAQEIKAFYDFARVFKIDLGILNPTKSWRKTALTDIVDLHANNFLVLVNKKRVLDWRVIDMECYYNYTRQRNSRHKDNVIQHIYGACL